MAADLRTTKQPKKQRGRRGQRTQQTRARVGGEQELDEVERAIALTSFISFCDTRPAEGGGQEAEAPQKQGDKDSNRHGDGEGKANDEAKRSSGPCGVPGVF